MKASPISAMRRRWPSRLALVVSVVIATQQSAGADTLFHVSEVVFEEEIAPRVAHHATQWEGDYYATDTDVSISGWGGKGDPRRVPYDTPGMRTNAQGTTFTSMIHRLAHGIDVVTEYDSFIVERRVEVTGPKSCSLQITVTLKPGHTLFEVHRSGNHELMLEASRRYERPRCELPPLVG